MTKNGLKTCCTVVGSAVTVATSSLLHAELSPFSFPLFLRPLWRAFSMKSGLLNTDYIDWSKGKIGVFPELKPSTKTISLRLPESLLAAIKTLANKRDVPYQSLMKVFLSQKLQDELNSLDSKSIQRITRSGR